MSRLSRYHGTICPYCERRMDIDHRFLMPTRDHIVPRIAGGRATIVCCKFCNGLKGHMMPDKWDAFRTAFPDYWKLAPRDRRLALAKHNREFKPSAGARQVRPVRQVSRRAIIVVPPDLIWRDAQLRKPTP